MISCLDFNTNPRPERHEADLIRFGSEQYYSLRSIKGNSYDPSRCPRVAELRISHEVQPLVRTSPGQFELDRSFRA